jgi:bifunctional ADP-heptose synthase (sugar kinase/adenylyltransferase)
MNQLEKSREGSRLVFCTSGCFLFFHSGHKDLLAHLVALAGDHPVVIAVNTDEYMYQKHSENINEILENPMVDTLDKLSLQVDLSVETRSVNVKDFVGDRAEVVVTDDLIASLDNSYYVVWVVGEDYLRKDFKERDKIQAIYIVPRSSGESSSQKLNELKEKAC